MDIVYSERHEHHATDSILFKGHPFVTEEVPARAETILKAIEAAKLGSIVPPVDRGLDPILAVHDAGFVTFLRTVYAEHAAYYGKCEPVFACNFATRYNGLKPRGFLGLIGYYAFGWDTPILKGTWEAAYWSAQCALTAAERLRSGKRAVYALCRPPGHHAASDLYGGFCYLNNAAIAARHLQMAGRVAVLDIDYHHGNGTQEIFYADPDVLFCSLHAHPDNDYPFYWGRVEECGEGPGTGTNCNWPLPQETDDEAYLLTLDAALTAIDGFAPHHLVVSAGLDIVAGDPVGGFHVTTDGLSEIGRRIVALGLPTAIVQEGGYLLDTLGENAIAFLQAFA